MLMLINGNSLPSSFVKATEEKVLDRDVGSWHLKESLDFFGNKLETELGQIHASEQEILKNTTDLIDSYRPDGIYGSDSEYKDEPGFIEDIIDFTDIVTFAISSDGAPFCFDYRKNKADPEIIWWDDVYWRKISNSYDDFIALFETNS